jgi:LasA protease
MDMRGRMINKRLSKRFILLFFLALAMACNLPLTKTKPFTGISPILTASAAARMGEPTNEIVEGNNPAFTSTGYYVIQSGDTLPALTSRFQIPESQMVELLPFLDTTDNRTTLPAGEVTYINLQDFSTGEKLKKILPNNYFVYGPTQADFDLEDFISRSSGWLNSYIDRSGGNAVSGIQIVRGTAESYSISPKVLLAVLEYHLHALSDPAIPRSFSLGNTEVNRKTLGKQLSWAANVLNNGYYGWREGTQVTFNDSQGQQITPNPFDNAASVGLIYYYSRFLSGIDLQEAISEQGFISTYQNLFGQIDLDTDQKSPLFPSDLQHPELDMPLQPGLKWAYTGGPHSGWGVGLPFAAIDFAPPAETAGCDPSPYWVTSASDGVISRVDIGSLTVDLDGDGKSATGWTVQYIHLSNVKTFSRGESIQKGEQLGHPSCIGGNSSGRNIHISRLYNGEWIPAGGVIPLVLEGWKAGYGEKEYKGSLTKGDLTLTASSVGEWFSQLPLLK